MENNDQMKSPNEFLLDCIEDFHNEAAKYGIAEEGIVSVPELLELGQKEVLFLLQDPFYAAEFKNDPKKYYYAIMSLSVETGMVLADRWHSYFSSLAEYVKHIEKTGPADDANMLFDSLFGGEIAESQGNSLFNIIFSRWLALHDPYWKLVDPRQYTFNALLASFQLGVSMVLDKYGYGGTNPIPEEIKEDINSLIKKTITDDKQKREDSSQNVEPSITNSSMTTESERNRFSVIAEVNGIKKVNYCWNCGAKLQDNSKYCHICGSKVSE